MKILVVSDKMCIVGKKFLKKWHSQTIITIIMPSITPDCKLIYFMLLQSLFNNKNSIKKSNLCQKELQIWTTSHERQPLLLNLESF